MAQTELFLLINIFYIENIRIVPVHIRHYLFFPVAHDHYYLLGFHILHPVKYMPDYGLACNIHHRLWFCERMREQALSCPGCRYYDLHSFTLPYSSSNRTISSSATESPSCTSMISSGIFPGLESLCFTPSLMNVLSPGLKKNSLPSICTDAIPFTTTQCSLLW